MRIGPQPIPVQPLTVWQEQAAKSKTVMATRCLQTALVRSPDTQGAETHPSQHPAKQ